MKLPNADEVLVERDKITGYLLNQGHPDNGGKARFFASLGFQSERWQELAHALKVLAGRESSVVKRSESAFGKKFVVDGNLEAPGGKALMVRTVWIVDRGGSAPRLVTAYPLDKGGGS